MTIQPTLTLAKFLLARIAEDEAVARALQGQWSGWGGRWYVCDDGHLEQPIGEWQPGEDRLPNHHNTWHLALDPARVLAECEAKRRIVEENSSWSYGWADCREYAMRCLALPYADHPDYREEWRP